MRRRQSAPYGVRDQARGGCEESKTLLVRELM